MSEPKVTREEMLDTLEHCRLTMTYSEVQALAGKWNEHDEAIIRAIRTRIERGPGVDEAWLIDAADAALVALEHRYRSTLTAWDTIAMWDILADVLEAAGVTIRGEPC